MPDESSVLAKSDHEAESQDLPSMEATEAAFETNENGFMVNGEAEEPPMTTATSRVLEYLQEAREESGGKATNGSVFHGYKSREGGGEAESQNDSHDSHPPHTNGKASPAASFSTPDDTPSVHVSVSVARI